MGIRASASSSDTVPEAASAASASAKACSLSASPTTIRGCTFQPAVNCRTSGSTFGNVGKVTLIRLPRLARRSIVSPNGSARLVISDWRDPGKTTRFLTSRLPKLASRARFILLPREVARAKQACARHRWRMARPDLSALALRRAVSPAHGRYRRAWPWHVPASMPIRRG